MNKIPSLRDVQLYQELDYPTVRVDIDRQKAGLSGVAVKDVTDALLVGTSSSRYVAKNYWRDPKSGVDYQVQIQVPEQRMDRPQQVETLPLAMANPDSNLMIRDVASVNLSTTPGEIDRSSMQRYLSITANIEGSDLGRAASSIEQAIKDAGQPPRGVRVSVRGQVTPMTEMFNSLAIGLALAVVVILVLLTGFFQSFRLGLISIGAVPGVVCGVVIILLATGTTPEYRVFYGLDHVHRRFRVELGVALRVHGRPLEGRGKRAKSGHRRRTRSLAPDSDDRRRHGVWHYTHGPCLGRRQ